MPCLSGEYNPAVGVLLRAAVLPGGTVAQQPQGQAPSFSSLIDTGADVTCISSNVAAMLGIQPSGKRSVVGATGIAEANQYIVDLLLQFGSESLVVPQHEVTAFPANSPHYDVLIGRDIICQGVLTVDFSGHFTFSV